MRAARPIYLLAVLLTAVPTLLAFPGCTETVEVPTAAELSIVQGHQQTGAAGSVLPTPVVLRVLGTDGAPLPQIPVSFNVIAGGGSIDPATAMSDANGEVRARWTLGPGSPVQSMVGSVANVTPVIISATGVLPAELTVAQGNNQTARTGTALPVQLVLRVTGGSNLPIPNQTVSFAIASGAGSITPQSAVTNAVGEVTVRWTLGPQPGLQTATASAATLGPIALSATAN